MYKKLCFLLIILALLGQGYSQVTMNLLVPPEGAMRKSQLWNMVLVNPGSALQVSIGLSLYSVADNQLILSATTGLISLGKGAKQINTNDAGVIQYNYYSSLFNTDRSPDGFLPIGQFKACYTVNNSEGNPALLAEDCMAVSVEPLSPPLLNTPGDKDTLDTQYPQFSWLPPMPVNLFSSLNYDLLVVEVKDGQTPEMAIQQNLPVYNIGNYTMQVNSYPASNMGLDSGKLYAWRIIAKNAGLFAAQSDVWVFSIRKPVNLPVDVHGLYFQMEKLLESAGNYHLTEPAIGLRYYSYDKAHPTLLSFKDAKGSIVSEVKINLIYGDNFLALPLGSRFKKGEQYRAEITDTHNNIFTVQFSIQP